MRTIKQSDLELISCLHDLVFNNVDIKNILEEAFKDTYKLFNDKEYALPYASINISIDVFNKFLPEKFIGLVKLCRVFILKKGNRYPSYENHRNSIQRLVSYEGKGTIYSKKNNQDTEFEAYPIISPVYGLKTDIINHWNIVPKNIWHYPKAGSAEDWLTVTFHSVTSNDIIDEYSESNS